MTRLLLPVTAAALLTLTGCVTGGRTPSLSGALAALPGTSDPNSKIASNVMAAMNGGLIGGPIGNGLGAADKRKALEAEYRALEYTPAGQRVAWSAGKRRGEVVAAPPYRVGSQDCRQYTHTVFAGGSEDSARGTACRNPDGSWTPLT